MAEIEEAAEDERLTAYYQKQAACEERLILWFWIVAGAATLVALFYGIYVLSPRAQTPSAF